MKLSLEREDLLKPLQMVIGVVERKQTLPILSNILLDTKDNRISITGTDLEIELIGQSTIQNEVASPAKITLPGRKLVDICKALPDGAPVELFQEKEKVILRSGRSRFTLSTLPAADFPSTEQQEGHVSFNTPQQTLKKLLQSTYFSMAQQDVRYYLNGLLLEITNGAIRAVATDGHRLATTLVDANVKVDHRLQVIVPRKGILELMRLLDDSEDDVSVSISSNHIRIQHPHFCLTSKLVEGRFPDYERVIPKNGDKVFQINRDVLKQALQRSAILCNEKFRGIRFELRNNLLRILANNPEQEAAEEELEIDYANEDLDIGFNVNYLIDILNTIRSEQVQFTFKDGNSSILVEEAGKASDSCFVVMPMRL